MTTTMNTTMERKQYSIFEDPKMKAAFQNLSKKDQDEYIKQGEHMYSKNYVDTKEMNEDEKMIDAAAYISEGLKSGLRPSQLENNEIEVMRSVFGELWFRRFNFESETD